MLEQRMIGTQRHKLPNGRVNDQRPRAPQNELQLELVFEQRPPVAQRLPIRLPRAANLLRLAQRLAASTIRKPAAARTPATRTPAASLSARAAKYLYGDQLARSASLGRPSKTLARSDHDRPERPRPRITGRTGTCRGAARECGETLGQGTEEKEKPQPDPE